MTRSAMHLRRELEFTGSQYTHPFDCREYDVDLGTVKDQGLVPIGESCLSAAGQLVG